MQWPKIQWPGRKEDRELRQEIEHHLDSLTEAYRKQGHSEAEARRLARIDFGGAEHIREECQEIEWWHWPSQLLRDVAFGVRMLRKTPALTGAALLSLALGIGATTAILSIAEVVLLRPLAISSPDHFYELMWESKDRIDLYKSASGSNFQDGAMRVADFFSLSALDAMRNSLAGKAHVASHIGKQPASVSAQGAVVVAPVHAVGGNFFQAVGVQPERGRGFVDEDDAASATPVAVISYAFWKTNLGSSEDVLNTNLRINNVYYRVVGVLPQAFFGIAPDDDTEIYVPIRQSPLWLQERSFYRERGAEPKTWPTQIVVRRMPEISELALREQLQAAFASSWVSQPVSVEKTPYLRLNNAAQGLGSLRRQMGNPLLMLAGLVLLVLTIACVNIANLLLARSVSREKEFALRAVLGSGRGRLLRQLFTESLLLALLGGACSIPVAWSLMKLIVTFMPDGFARVAASGPDWRMLAATATITVVTAILFGLYPSWRGGRVNVAPALKEGAGSAGTHSRWTWAPAKALVLLQISLSVLLVSSAILFTGYLWDILHRDTGYAQGNLLFFDLRPGEAGHRNDRLRQFYLQLEARLATVPGVESVGLSQTRPMRGGGYWNTIKLPGQTAEGGISAGIHHATPNFLDALGVPLLAGRNFTQQELARDAKVVLISEKLSRELGLNNPIGERIVVDNIEQEIVGLTKDARYARMTDDPPVVYMPLALGKVDSATIALRTSMSPMALLPTVRAAIQELDRDLPLVDIYTMEQQISRTLQRERLFAWLCGSFGVLALVLCVVGLFGLFSYTTARRIPEIGIRMAVGASRANVVKQVFAEGLRLTVAGIIPGIPLAAYAGWIARSQQLLPEDASSYAYSSLAIALGILAASALLAVAMPAIRASRVDPISALRNG